MPTYIVQQLVLPPAGQVKRRICHDEICLELGMAVIKESIRIKFAKVSFDSSNRKVHLRHFPSSRVGVLTKHRNFVDVTAMILDELCRLHKHSAAAATGIRCRTEIDTM